MCLRTLSKVALLNMVVVLMGACSTAAEDVEALDNKVPQTVNAQSKDTEVVVTWKPVPDAEHYIVCWAYVPITDCDSANPNIVRTDAITETWWTHKDITNSTVYYYAVIALSSTAGESALSANVIGRPEGITPPRVVSISTYDLTATVAWEPVEGADGYRVHMAIEEGIIVGNPGFLNGYMPHNVPAGELTFTQAGLIEGQNYYFIVTALKSLGGVEILESTESLEVMAQPKALAIDEGGYVPNDFTVKVGSTGFDTANEKVEYIDLYLSDPCTEPGTRNQALSMHWSGSPIVNMPLDCSGASEDCFADVTAGGQGKSLTTSKTPPPNSKTINEGSLYYFTVVNLPGNQCGTSALPGTGKVMTGNVAVRTPGAMAPVAPVISAVFPVNIEHAVTITIDQPVEGLIYNLYMVSQQFFDGAADRVLTADNFELDVDWGMKHSNIPASFTHRALPGSWKFYFIVTAVNEIGVESEASNIVTASP